MTFASSSDSPIRGTGPACPQCGKPVDPQHRPFCSARCKQVDLGRWFSETYRIETDEGLSENKDLD